MARKGTLRERFFRHVSPEPMSGCWLWTGAVARGGYGDIGRGAAGTGNDRAHRVAWRLFRGEIPDGSYVLHRCDNPACVNPDHLFVGTHLDNMRDMTAKRRHWQHLRPGTAPKGEECGRVTLTEAQVQEIRRLYAEDSSRGRRTAIGRRFGVTRTAVYCIVAGRTWNHLPTLSPAPRSLP